MLISQSLRDNYRGALVKSPYRIPHAVCAAEGQVRNGKSACKNCEEYFIDLAKVYRKELVEKIMHKFEDLKKLFDVHIRRMMTCIWGLQSDRHIAAWREFC